ncbi:tetratricopeptide repeat protein [Oleiharenicola lentus]|uniref:Tetratricopeptide repeat protein n=1 Tax=Oleiharenicola lentus TaxID=2508720 RepID=A0A4Q1CCC2_9BACT|nr:tetratricopeptide repeat protein [Oleiharenicola lentus]RXK56773.1 tetratricopeptide repeat protein [Oleiharenicola lentus]
MEPGREEHLMFAKHFERAQGWLLLENHAAAERALRLIPSAFRGRSEVQQFRAQLYLAAGRWARAVPLLRKLVKADPSEAQYWVSLAFAVRRADSIAAAEKILREARERFPQEAVIWFNLACYAAQQDRLPEAHNWLREAVRREAAYRELAKTDTDLAPFWKAVADGVIAAPWGD